MALVSQMTFVLVGEIGRTAKMSVSNTLNDAAKRDAFITFLNTNSTGKVSNASLTEWNPQTTPPDVGSNTDRRLVCYLRDNSDNSVVRSTIPSPVASIVQADLEGERATSAFLTALAAEYTTLTGRTHTPLHGYVIQKK